MKVCMMSKFTETVEKIFRFQSYKKPDEQILENISTKVAEEDKNGSWKDEDGVIYSVEGKKLLKCNNNYLTSYVVRQGMRVICDNAFSWCKFLQSVSIPDTVTRIGDWTFRNCSSLRSVSIPDSVTSIGDNAFGDCSSLKSIMLPDSVTSIGHCAFIDCI